MQIVRVLFYGLIFGQLFLCGVSSKWLCSVLALLPAASCAALHHSGFIFVSSSSELVLTPGQQAQWEQKQLRGGWVWPLGWGRKYQPCLSRLGQSVPETVGALFCTFCLGLACLGSLESSSFLPFLRPLQITTVPLPGMFSAKPGFSCKHRSLLIGLFSWATPCRPSEWQAGICWAKPGSEILLTPQTNSCTENQNCMCSFILSSNYLLTSTYNMPDAGLVYFFLSFRSPQSSGEQIWKQRSELGRPAWG